jgi:molybdate transport system substrate-binding protein
MRRLLLPALVLAMQAAGLAVPAAAATPDIVVFAAASLKNALDDIAAQYRRETGQRVAISYAASSTLARQIEAGAPADIFISADLDWMDYLAKRKLIQPRSRIDLLSNSIVLVTPAAEAKPVAIMPHFPLAALLHGGRLAMADPQSVPAGRYGKAALEKLGVWQAVAARVAPAENVRAALAFVAHRECPLGIVYSTDAAVEPGVKIVGTFPPDSHPPIIYPMALIVGRSNPDAARFAAYLRSPAARQVFEKAGFGIIAGGSGG